MQAGLQISVVFGDVAPPTLRLITPGSSVTSTQATFRVAGSGSDNHSLAEVVVQANSGPWIRALTSDGWTHWALEIPLVDGTNTIRALAIDASGNRSATNSGRVLHTPNYRLEDYAREGVPGSEWVYRRTGSRGGAEACVVRVDAAPHSLDVYRGRAVPFRYSTNVVAFRVSYCSYADGVESGVEALWHEYFTSRGGVRFWGADGDSSPWASGGGTGLRVDGGLLLGDISRVGQHVSGHVDLYENGLFQGASASVVRLLERTNLVVPAGSYADCLHLRVVLGGRTNDLWWAKGVGEVKRRTSDSAWGTELLELVTHRILPAPTPPHAVPAAAGPGLEATTLDGGITLGLWHDSNHPSTLRLGISAPPGALVVLEASENGSIWSPFRRIRMPDDGSGTTIPLGHHGDSRLLRGYRAE